MNKNINDDVDVDQIRYMIRIWWILWGSEKKCLPVIYFTHTHWVNMFSIYLIDACIHKIFGIIRWNKLILFFQRNGTLVTVFCWNILMKQSWFFSYDIERKWLILYVWRIRCDENCYIKLTKKNHTHIQWSIIFRLRAVSRRKLIDKMRIE